MVLAAPKGDVVAVGDPTLLPETDGLPACQMSPIQAPSVKDGAGGNVRSSGGTESKEDTSVWKDEQS